MKIICAFARLVLAMGLAVFAVAAAPNPSTPSREGLRPWLDANKQ